MPKYAVAVGHRPGVYDTWAECSAQVLGAVGAVYKKFSTEKEAIEFIAANGQKRKRKLGEDAPDSGQDLFAKVAKLSAAPISVESRLAALEATVSAFIDKTSALLDGLVARVARLEGGVGVTPSPRQLEVPVAPSSSLGPDRFIRNEKNAVVVYTDGACSSNGRAGAKAGIGVWFNHGHPLNVSEPVHGPPTNNTAEIQAARVAITKASSAGVRHLSVHTDSKFVIDCITKWIHKWKKNDWKLAGGGAVKNKVELVKLDQAIQQVDVVEWVHVRGHCGTLGNEEADALARSGAARFETNVRYADHVDSAD